jgi:isopenicillin N synthase-like dioxygenase
VAEFDRIPVIDLAPLNNPEGVGVDRLCDDILTAYGTVGFGYLINHGIDPALIEGVFDASARFHAMPRAAKMQVELNELHRGFISINTSTDRNSKLARVTKPNQSESFMMMREAGPDDADIRAGAYLAGPNQWPEGLAGFREAVSAYHDALSALAGGLVRVIARGLGADEAVFAEAFDPPTTWLRLLHYPPQPPFSPEDLYGSAPHTDFGCITLLAQDGVGGLQVKTPAGAWVDAPPLPGSFVMNVGDMLHRWSNGRLLSTPHRVINRSGRERYSCPFFYDPNVATGIVPLQSCLGPANPPRFAPLVFGEFLRAELKAGYQLHAKGR